MTSACSSLNKSSATEAQVGALQARLDSILHREDDGRLHYGARVVEISTGREIYAHEIDQPLMPASNGKIAVGAAGMDMFGPDHVFKTYLAIDGDDLWLIGTGDPAPGDSKIAKAHHQTTVTLLEQWAAALKKRGVSHVKGKLYYYDAAFEAQQIHPSWSKSFAGDWYAAPVGGLNFNDNCVDIAVKPTTAGELVSYTVTPPVKNIRIVNECKSGGKGDADVDREPDAMVYKLKNSATQPTELQSKSVVDPGAFFADALRTQLETKGIKIDGQTQRADHPLGGKNEPPIEKIVAVNESKMSDVMWRINKDSQNMFAEAMCKNLGRAWAAKQGRDEPGSWENGGKAVREFMKKNGIDDSKYVIVDGSGLSRENRVTAHIVSEVFVAMARHRNSEAFRKSLSVVGEDGTLKKRMKEISGRFMGKTGYIGGVRSLSGYVKTRDGSWLVVSMIFNGIEGTVKRVEEMQDDVVRVLVDYPNLKPATQPATHPTTAPAVARVAM
jgi:D-alanyl-D-alanine carboxypeptidase/D-alanyl-D-alanine-endopeptidase (penicillin-binding protein 4)